MTLLRKNKCLTMKQIYLPSIFFMIGLLSCSSFTGPVREDHKAQAYDIGSLNAPWKIQSQKKEDGPDKIFVSEQTGSVIAVNSLCDRYKDSSLRTLTKDLTRSYSDEEFVKQESLYVDEREALKTSVKGKMDGVPMESVYVVLKKNDCLFDFSLHAKDQLTDQERNDFDSFIAGFKFDHSSKEHINRNVGGGN